MLFRLLNTSMCLSGSPEYRPKYERKQCRASGVYFDFYFFADSLNSICFLFSSASFLNMHHLHIFGIFRGISALLRHKQGCFKQMMSTSDCKQDLAANQNPGKFDAREDRWRFGRIYILVFLQQIIK